MKNFPGSVIEKEKLSGEQFLNGMFNGSKGLVMSQIKEFTGLNTPAIQNWINRGWLSHPVRKKYNKDQVARILIINMLRQTMSLEDISKLLFYVNGKTEDTSDDIISEAKLYGYICDLIFSDKNNSDLDARIDELLKDFQELHEGDRLRLKRTLTIVYLHHTAAVYLQNAKNLLNDSGQI